MRQLAALLTVTTGLALAAIAPAGAQRAGAAPSTTPSFDCRRAGSDVELAICSDARAARADAAVARAYQAALRRFTGPARAALQEDQRWFLAARDRITAYGDMTQAQIADDVRQMLEFRASDLSRMTPAPGPGLVGTWRAVNGEVVVRSGGPGQLAATFNTVNPDAGRWICEAGATLRLQQAGRAEGPVSDDPRWRVTVRRDGQALRVIETGPADETRPYCGFNGSLEGVFFPVPPGAR